MRRHVPTEAVFGRKIRLGTSYAVNYIYHYGKKSVKVRKILFEILQLYIFIDLTKFILYFLLTLIRNDKCKKVLC